MSSNLTIVSFIMPWHTSLSGTFVSAISTKLCRFNLRPGNTSLTISNNQSSLYDLPEYDFCQFMPCHDMQTSLSGTSVLAISKNQSIINHQSTFNLRIVSRVRRLLLTTAKWKTKMKLSGYWAGGRESKTEKQKKNRG
jgi:hypothetical protein